MSSLVSTPPSQGARKGSHTKGGRPFSSKAPSDLSNGSRPFQKKHNASMVAFDHSKAIIDDVSGFSSEPSHNVQTSPPRTPKPRSQTDFAMTSDSSALSGRDNISSRKKGSNHHSNNRQKPRVRDSSSSTPLKSSEIQSSHKASSSRMNQGVHHTPAHSTGTPARAAYAGPTFHASPAPSALPMPSFLSKSVPEDSNGGLQARLDEESSASTDSSPTMAVPSSSETPQRRESTPLDLFFRADREEKAKARAASAAASQAEPVSPSLKRQSVGVSQSAHSTPFGDQPRQQQRQSASNNEMFHMDMEGTRGSVGSIGPAFSTPYAQRMNALRAQSTPSSVVQEGDKEEEKERQAKTQALKNLLMNPQQSSSLTSHHHSEGDLLHPRFGSQSPGSQTFLGNIQPRQSLPMTDSLHSTPQTFSRSPHNHGVGALHRMNSAGTGSPKSNSRPSNLRRQVSTNTPERTPFPHFPTSPSPSSRASQLDAATISRNNLNAHIERSGSSSLPASRDERSNLHTPTKASDANSSAIRQHSDVQAMENDLRRILKLDGFIGTGGSPFGNGAPVLSASPGHRPTPGSIRDGVF